MIIDEWLRNNNALKNVIFFGFALAVTFFLFIIIQILVVGQNVDFEETIENTPIDFIRLKRDEDVNIKNRKPPRPYPKIYPAPLVRPSIKSLPPPPELLTKNLPDLKRLSLMNRQTIPFDREVLPLVRIPPSYPPRALQRGIEGWVLLEFTISRTGHVINPKVIRADPPVIFDYAALRAVRRWRYKPQIVNGEAINRPGVQTVIAFELEQ